MKILIFCGDKYHFVRETANYLSEEGVQVHVACPKFMDGLIKNVRFHYDLISNSRDNTFLNFINLPFNVIILRKLIKKINPDVLHVFNVKWSGWIAALSNFHPYIITGMGSDILKEQGSEKNFVIKYLKNYSLKKADIITVVSDQMRKHVRAICPCTKIILFRIGVNLTKFVPGLCSISLAKRIKKNVEKIIFSPRQTGPLYQTVEIVKAFSKVKNIISNIQLIIKASHRGKYFEEVMQLIDRLNLEKHVHLIDYVKFEEWIDYYRLSDLVISYPKNDGMPATAFEAMAMEKPLILSNSPSIVEVFTNNYDALICDRNNIDELADCIRKLLDNNKEREKIIHNAKKTVASIGDARIYIKNLLENYQILTQKSIAHQ